MRLGKARTRTQFKKIREIYEASFPAYEKKPFWLIRLKNKQGRADVWFLEEKAEIVGIAITMSAPNLMLLDYFAIAENVRGRGFGSQALKLLQNQYKDRKFFLEIESIYDECDNVEQRKRRKQFYLKNGMTEMELMANVFGTNMEVLGHECKLDFPKYCSVYLYTYGKKVMKKIKHLPYPAAE